MFRNIRNIFRSGAKPAKSPRRSSLRMETLEGRELMAAGIFDTNFADDGTSTVPLNRPAVSTAVIKRLSSGRILVGTTVAFSNGDTDFSVTRLQGNGNIDGTFGINGTTRIAFDRGGSNRDTLADIDVDSAGRIVLVGSVEFAGNDFDFGAARLLPNGSVDSSFGTGGKTTVHFDIGGDRADVPTAVEIDSANRVVVAGTARVTDTTRDVAVIRLTTAGRVDSSFGNGGRTVAPINRNGICDDAAGGMALDSRGRIVIAASAQFRPGSNDYDFAALRLNSAGFYDRSFDGDGIAIAAFDLGGSLYDFAKDVAIGPDDSVVVAGTVGRAGSDSDFGVARFTKGGGLDFNFDGDGRVVVAIDRGGDLRDDASSVAVDGLNRIVVAGRARVGTAMTTAVVRLSPSGSRDGQFGVHGVTVASLNEGTPGSAIGGGVEIDPQQNVLIAGVNSTNNLVVGRILGS